MDVQLGMFSTFWCILLIFTGIKLGLNGSSSCASTKKSSCLPGMEWQKNSALWTRDLLNEGSCRRWIGAFKQEVPPEAWMVAMALASMRKCGKLHETKTWCHEFMKNYCKWYCTNLYDTSMMDLFSGSLLTSHWFLVSAQVHHRWALSQQSLSRGPREKWMKHASHFKIDSDKHLFSSRDMGIYCVGLQKGVWKGIEWPLLASLWEVLHLLSALCNHKSCSFWAQDRDVAWLYVMYRT